MIDLLVLENCCSENLSNLTDFLDLFPARHCLVVTRTDDMIRVIDRSRASHLSVMTVCSTLDFYKNIAVQLPNAGSILRVSGAKLPLPKALAEEINTTFPSEEFDYVLSLPDNCCLTNFFIERLSRRSLDAISHDVQPIMPPGYFNGLAHSHSARHFYSLKLQSFFLNDNFDLFFNSPRTVAINLISQCNYKCSKCEFHSPRRTVARKIDTKIIDLDLFREILSKCHHYSQLKVIAPTLSGEPLLHPQISAIVAEINKQGYSCAFATNASLLTPELGMQLLDAGVGALAFSVDAATPQTYAALQGGDLHQIERNILNFQELSIKRLGFFSGTMNFVLSPHNADEAEEFRSRWLARGFAVCISSEFDVWNHWKPYKPDHRWIPSHHVPCPSLWHALYLDGEGRNCACGKGCCDGLRSGESFFDSDPYSFWRSDFMNLLRQTQLKKRPLRCEDDLSNLGMSGTWIFENGRLRFLTATTCVESPPEVNNLPKSGLPGFFPRRFSTLARKILARLMPSWSVRG